MLLSVFCTWFVTLWKSSFPRNPPTPRKLVPLNPPSPSEFPMVFRWGGYGYFLEPHIFILHGHNMKVPCVPFYGGHKHMTWRLLSLSDMGAVPKNSTPGKLTLCLWHNIWQLFWKNATKSGKCTNVKFAFTDLYHCWSFLFFPNTWLHF